MRVLLAGTMFAVLIAAAGAARAQFFAEGSFPPVYAPAQMPDAAVVPCRLAYTRVRQEYSGIGWQTDYPYAEINLMTRASELTRLRVSRQPGGEPRHYVVRATDPQLFNCPLLLASDAGTIGFTATEVARLREYLLKGGFLWADDFWGEAAWQHWALQISQVLPPPTFAIEDVPLSDPMLRTIFEIEAVPQVPSIQFWRQVGGTTTSERGAETEVVNLRAIRNGSGRIMVLMTHNTDIADAWEREADDPVFFYEFSPPGYALGLNVLLHVLTH